MVNFGRHRPRLLLRPLPWSGHLPGGFPCYLGYFEMESFPSSSHLPSQLSQRTFAQRHSVIESVLRTREMNGNDLGKFATTPWRHRTNGARF